jgi:hypothetical protein
MGGQPPQTPRGTCTGLKGKDFISGQKYPGELEGQGPSSGDIGHPAPTPGPHQKGLRRQPRNCFPPPPRAVEGRGRRRGPGDRRISSADPWPDLAHRRADRAVERHRSLDRGGGYRGGRADGGGRADRRGGPGRRDPGHALLGLRLSADGHQRPGRPGAGRRRPGRALGRAAAGADHRHGRRDCADPGPGSAGPRSHPPCPRQRRGRADGAALPVDPHLGRARHHRALCRNRLADRDRAHPLRPGNSALHQRS